MATTNAEITRAWSKLADDSDDPVTIQVLEHTEWEVAAVATDTDPTVKGHVLFEPMQAITRENFGAGYIYARTVTATQATAVVTK